MGRDQDHTSEQMNHEGQKSYAGQWGEQPADQPKSAADRVRDKLEGVPERPIAIDGDDDEGEFDENLTGNKRPASD